MYKQRSRPSKILGLLGASMLIVTACGSSATPSPAAATAAPTTAPSVAAPTPIIITPPPIAEGPGPNGGTVVEWFIGLGAGTQPAQIGPEQAFATKFNASQKDVYLQLDIVDNTQAANILKTRIAAGNTPDIIGPVGVEGLNIFRDQLQDLAPTIAKDNYKFDGVDQSLVDFFKLGNGGATVGVPFAVYPSYIFYNKALFKEAGLPDLPTKVGDTYQGKPWDIDALRTVAMKLTVDKAGKDATQAGFDANNIVQWGFDSQYQDNSARAEDAFFGAGSFLADDGKTAQIPDYVTQGEKWFNDGVWKDHFIPTAAQVNSALLGAGGEFGSGNLAMDEGHTWFTCCVTPTPSPSSRAPRTSTRPGSPSRRWSRRRICSPPMAPCRLTRTCRPLGSPPSTRASRASSWTGPFRSRCSRTRTSRTTSPGCLATPRPRPPSRPSRTSTGPRPGLTSTRNSLH
jgi:multiple sugar transport system substrate-binding protein